MPQPERLAASCPLCLRMIVLPAPLYAGYEVTLHSTGCDITVRYATTIVAEHTCGTPQDSDALAHATSCPRCRSLYPGVTHGGCLKDPHPWHIERHAVED